MKVICDHSKECHRIICEHYTAHEQFVDHDIFVCEPDWCEEIDGAVCCVEVSDAD